MSAVDKAKALLKEKEDNELCLKAGICPVDGTPLVRNWLEEQTGWLGRKKKVKVDGFDGHEFHPYSEAHCPYCLVTYLIWD